MIRDGEGLKKLLRTYYLCYLVALFSLIYLIGLEV